MNDGLYSNTTENIINIEYNYIANKLTREIIDLRSVSDQYYGHAAEVYFLSDEELLTDKCKGINLNKDDMHSMNQVIMLTTSKLIKKYPFEIIYLLYKSRFTHDKKIIFAQQCSIII